MKTFLLIYVISLQDGQQPSVQKLEQADMASCQAQAKVVQQQLRDPTSPGARPFYIVRTQCVTATN